MSNCLWWNFGTIISEHPSLHQCLLLSTDASMSHLTPSQHLWQTFFFLLFLFSSIVVYNTVSGIHIMLPSFSPQFLSRVIIIHYHCQTSPFSVLTAPPQPPSKLPTKDQSYWPSFLFMWVYFPHYLFLNTLQMSPIILCLSLFHWLISLCMVFSISIHVLLNFVTSNFF